MYLKQSYKRLNPSALVKGFHLKQLVNVFLVRGCAILFLALPCSLGGCSADRESSRDQEMLAKAREIIDRFLSYELTGLASYLNHEEFPLDSLRHLRDWVSDRLGEESEVLREDLYAIGCRQKYYYYVRFSTFDKRKQPVSTSFQFSGDYHVRQLAIDTLGEPAPTDFEHYQTKTRLRLPFEDEWYVASGGRELFRNLHVTASDQRFAYDFAVRKGGAYARFRPTESVRNEHYYCFGQRVLAPGAGVVVSVEDTVENNEIYTEGVGAGNHIVIDHGQNEFSFLCHLIKGSAAVSVGDSVQSGDLVGLCGNSGYTTMPCLHYHLQNTPVLYFGDGLPVQFEQYVADGVSVIRGEPQAGQKVKNN